jgi:hypothetical protein
VHTGEKKKLGWVTGDLSGERAGVEIKEQVSAWSIANRRGFAGQREIPLVPIIERKNDPLTVVFEGNLKPGLRGVPDWLEMSGFARGPGWPAVDEVLGPGRWWPGRLGDDNTRMPWSRARGGRGVEGGICTGVATGAGVTG